MSTLWSEPSECTDEAARAFAEDWYRRRDRRHAAYLALAAAAAVALLVFLC